MTLNVRTLEKQHALVILAWRYPPPYDRYNFEAHQFEAHLRDLLDAQNAFFALINATGELEGFCSFGLGGRVSGGDYRAEALDIGMGLRPDLVGQGHRYAQSGFGNG